MKVVGVAKIISKCGKEMYLNDDWVHGVRNNGRKDRRNNKIEIFVKIRNTISLCGMKQYTRDR